MTEKDFFEKISVLLSEFSKYVLEHPEMDEQIPDGAQVVLLLENDPEFNKRNTALAKLQQEKEQPVVFVKIKELAPAPASRIVKPQLELAVNIWFFIIIHN